MPSNDREITDGLRNEILVKLVDQEEAMTPSELANELGTYRQKVHQHLDELVRMGLVVPDDGTYYCQPVFTDPRLRESFVDAMNELVPEMEGEIHIPPECEWGKGQVILNCLRVFVALHFLENRHVK